MNPSNIDIAVKRQIYCGNSLNDGGAKDVGGRQPAKRACFYRDGAVNDEYGGIVFFFDTGKLEKGNALAVKRGCTFRAWTEFAMTFGGEWYRHCQCDNRN